MTADPTKTATRRKLAITGGVVVVHAYALWALGSALSTRPVQDVVTLQLSSPPAEAAAPAPVVANATPAKPAVPAVRNPLPPANRPAVTGAQPEVPAPAVATPPPVLTAAGSGQAVAVSTATTSIAQSSTTSSGIAAALATAAAGPSNTAAGNHVELPSSDADYLHNPKPEYPRLSRQRNEQGKVVVNVLIGTDGVAQKAELKVSSGFERLDAAAVATARSWRYVPGKRGGVPEAMWFAVPINFVME